MSHSTSHHGDRSKSATDDLTELRRLAALIGDGQVPFPTDRAAGELQKLSRLVRQHRRHVLLDFLACQVALDLLRNPAGPGANGTERS